MNCILFLAAALASAWADAQPLRVFSEFVQFDKAGDPAIPALPREILSPALVRNGFTSFQISIQGPPRVRWTLYVGLNPEEAVKVTLYRRAGDAWELAEQPVQGEGVQILWMDVWTDRGAPVQRIKIEPQLMVGTDWVIYPMEGRVMDAVVPSVDKPPARLCGKFAPAEGERQVRNARQDAALAAIAPRDELRRALNGCDVSAPENPESYLRIRDYLFRLR